MASLISVWGKHTEYPIHVSIEGKERFYKSFSISFDAESGELQFKGVNTKGMTEKLMKVEP